MPGTPAVYRFLPADTIKKSIKQTIGQKPYAHFMFLLILIGCTVEKKVRTAVSGHTCTKYIAMHTSDMIIDSHLI